MPDNDPKKPNDESAINKSSGKQPEEEQDSAMPPVSSHEGLEQTEFSPESESSPRISLRQTVGPYKILQKIAEGGMGAVYMAEQSKPVRRRVALKVIKAGKDSEQIITRFEAERQALSMMNHPNIAKVLDVGATDDGSPYFAMELVKGVPLTQYCDQNKLSIRERLELFIPVCKAVQHAHQKGIIHRDLKPSNVLVALYDGEAVPKVIDFGLAKATEHQTKLTDKTMFTEFGAVVGTLQYMSPEQAEMNQLDVDTRTDIYSLGVMLYELLTGSTPLERETLGQAAVLKVLEIIREKDPPRPSVRLSNTANDTVTSVSDQRKIQPAKLRQILRGELDWIVMKSLEKDRMRRYETATSFGEDIQRYLDDEAINARPPSTAYKASKFVRKNRGLVAGSAIVLAVLIGGIASTSYGLVAANNSAELERIAKEDAIAQKLKAEKAAKRSSDILSVVTDGFSSIDPNSGTDADMKAKDVLFRVQASLESTELDDEGKAEILRTLAASFIGLGEFNSAIATATDELTIRKKQHGPKHPTTLKTMNNLAFAYEGAGQLKEAMSILQQTLSIQKEKLGTDHLDTLTTMNNLASAYTGAGRLDEAIALHEQALEIQKGKLGSDHPKTLTTKNDLAVAYSDAGRLKEAIPIYQQTLAIQKEKLGPDHPDTLKTMNNLAVAFAKAGRLDEAIPIYQQTLAISKEKLGPDHPDTLTSMNNLAVSYWETGRREEAIPIYQQTLAIQKEKAGSDHPHTLIMLNNLALAYAHTGRLDEAITTYQQTLAIQKEKLGNDHPDTLITMNNLAFAYADAGRLKEEITLYEQTLTIRKQKLGIDHPDTLLSMNNLAVAYAGSERREEAIPILQQALALQKEKLGIDHPDTLLSMNNLGAAYADAGRLKEAIMLYEPTLEISKEKLGPDHPDTLKTMNELAVAYSKAGRQEEAIQLHKKTLNLKKEQLGRDHPHTLDSMDHLALAYADAGRLKKAITLNEQTLTIRKQKLGHDLPATLLTMNNLAVAYSKAGRQEEAIQLHKKTLNLKKEKLGRDHPDTLSSMVHLTDIYVSAGRDEEALPLFLQILSVRKEQLGPEHASTLYTMIRLSETLLKTRDYAQAEKILRDCYFMRKKNAPDKWTTFNAQSLLGEAMLGLENMEEAQSTLIESYRGMEERKDKIPIRYLNDAVKRLIQFAEVTGNEEELKKWQTELELYAIDKPKGQASEAKQ